MIPVTKTFLPPLQEYNTYLERIWESAWMTNRGELVRELEEKLKTYLDISNILITNNGTLPLQIALRLLGNGGEVITTPFSYVATTAAIVWEHCTPVFVDIHPEYLTIDETKIEAAITPRTTCILATHVFGNPCNIDAIEGIAEKHNLKVIYDAAHCFGVTYKEQSIFDFGDVSTCSFHATKLFHTGEGGAVFCKDESLRKKIYYTHNFGHNGPLDFHGLGINAKISELQAAMGLAVFPHLHSILRSRQKVIKTYDAHLNLGKVRKIRIRENTEWNSSYYPVIYRSEEILLQVEKKLQEQQIFPRRYFYPSLNTIPYTKGTAMPVSESIAGRIMCLPLFNGLPIETIQTITQIINSEN